jgi:hypothetical protein
MTCREFERKFNELIDAEGKVAASGRGQAIAIEPQSLTSDLERALLDHAKCCPACRQMADGYRVLRRALYAWNSPPVAPAALADRILAARAEWDAPAPAPSAWAVGGEHKRETWRPLVLMYGSILAAAAAIGLVLPAINLSLRRELQKRASPPVASFEPADRFHSVGGSSSPTLANSRILNNALADATAATLDLARSASEPAARISRQMLDAANNSELPLHMAEIPGHAANGIGTMPALGNLPFDPSAAGSLFQDVGDQLASRVAPLSKTARHAFGFLLGAPASKSGGHGGSPAAKGA